jgi:hypothetical protein
VLVLWCCAVIVVLLSFRVCVMYLSLMYLCSLAWRGVCLVWLSAATNINNNNFYHLLLHPHHLIYYYTAQPLTPATKFSWYGDISIPIIR